jgi:hypothetical protein
MSFLIPDDAGDLPGLLVERKPRDATVAYVCSGMSCQAPISDLESFRLTLTHRGENR